MRQQFWSVSLDGLIIDSVPYDCDIGAESVKHSLVNHDGYDPGISVFRDEPPTTPPKLLLTIPTGGHPITIVQLGPDHYRVAYGSEYHSGTRAAVSGHIGHSVFHALESEGRLDA